MRNPTLAAHTPAAITMMDFFLFQMAMLAKPLSKLLPRKDSDIARNEDNIHAEHDQEVSGSNS
jgi:hypothetical protein